MAQEDFIPASQKLGMSVSEAIAKMQHEKQLRAQADAAEEARILASQEARSQAEIEKEIRDKQTLDELIKGHPNASIRWGEGAYNPEPSSNPYLSTIQQERENRAAERGAEKIVKSNIPQATGTLQRLEEASPGAIRGEAEFKSRGGLKNLIPNAIVPMLEKVGLMQKGASRERSALQDVANIKIYDSSGKQINEQEMERINESMGFSPFSDPKALQDAINQMGYKVGDVYSTYKAGMTPQTVKILEERGAVQLDPLTSLLKPRDGAVQPPQEELVPVINPSGKPTKIKKSDLDKALKRGFKVR